MEKSCNQGHVYKGECCDRCGGVCAELEVLVEEPKEELPQEEPTLDIKPEEKEVKLKKAKKVKKASANK